MESNTYSYVYSNDPDTLDYVNSNRATTSDVIANLVDGLLENDEYGNLVPSIAEDWTVSKDGLTYTYKLRKDAKWYTSDGEEYAEVKAQDFVTGLKHAADEKSEALPIVQSSIKGLDAYVKGQMTFQPSVSRLSMTIQLSTLLTSQKVTGTLKLLWGFCSRSMRIS